MTAKPEPDSEAARLLQAIQALESQRPVLGDAVVEAALAPLREKLASFQTNSLGEQRKLVTILFADLVNFTALSARLDPEDVREVMNACFQRWSACIGRHAGVVEKYIGDAVLAVFGLPAAHENDPEQAIRTALEMLSELRQLNEQFKNQLGQGLAMRVGINTGEVVVSLLGERQGEEFVVVGDTVNLASRLQAAAPAGEILITQATFRHVHGLFETSPFGPLQLKGTPEPVQAYLVKGVRPRTYRREGRGVAGVETPLVGRQAELGQLQEAFQRAAAARKLQAVTLVGEAGLGKSRLLYEFEAWLEGLPETVTFFRGRAHPSSQHLPYSLVRDLFADRCQVQDSDPPAIVRHKLEKGLDQALGGGVSGQMKAHRVARLLGFEIGESEHQRGVEADAKSLHDQAMVHLGGYFQKVGEAGPVVVLLEDLHWADDSSLDLLSHLEDLLADGPFLFAASARPSLFEHQPEWAQGRPSHTRLELTPLPRDAGQALVREILKRVDHLPSSLRDLVVNTAEGNPYYIEELVKMLIEDEVILTGEGHWRVDEGQLGDLRVPPTLAEVLQARFDSLEPQGRLILQRGAVIGRVFWDQAVESLGDRPGESTHLVPGNFDELRTRELIFRNAQSAFEGTVEYQFKHALLRDVTYGSLLKRQRRIYHGLAARWLEGTAGRTQRGDEFAMLIAEHYQAAGEPGPASEWYLRAGRVAARRYANREALHALGLALELAPEATPGWKFSILLEREKIYELLGQRDERLLDLEALQGFADQTGDPFYRATAALRKARYAFQTAELSAALQHSRHAEGFAESIQNQELTAQSALLQSGILMRQGERDLSEIQAQRALTLAAQQGLTGVEAEGYRQLGLVAYYKGKPHQARDYFSRALKLFEQAGDRSGAGLAVNNLGGANFNAGDYTEAGRYYARSLQMCREIGDRMGEGRALNNLGIVAVTQGNYAQAESYYQQTLQISREVGNRTFETSVLDNLGNLASYRYNYSLAQKYQLESLRGAHQIGDRVSESFARINLARACLAVGDYESALAYAQESLNLNRQLNDSQGSCMALIYLSLLLMKTGDVQSAQASIEEALALAQEGDLRSELGWAAHVLAGVHFSQGRYLEAAESFRQAIEIRQALDETKEAIESQAGLASACLEIGDLEQATGLIEGILSDFANHGLEGFDRPIEIFLACYRVLLASQDPRAPDILRQGYDLLQTIASKIEDESQRRSYLERVPENTALLEAWSKSGSPL